MILKYFLKNNEKVSGKVTHRTLWACGHMSTAVQVPKSKPATTTVFALGLYPYKTEESYR